METLEVDFEDTSRSGLKNNLKTAQEELVTDLTFLHQVDNIITYLSHVYITCTCTYAFSFG